MAFEVGGDTGVAGGFVVPAAGFCVGLPITAAPMFLEVGIRAWVARNVSHVPLIGWGDESGSDAARDPGTYLLSVVLADPDDIEPIREAMRGLLHKGSSKLHWRDEIPRRQRAIAAAVTELPISGMVVVRSRPRDGERPERRRRKCLEQLLPMLSERGCSRVVLESRGPKDDARDRAMLDNLRRSHRLTHRLHLDHVPGPKDPALWAADALCGAVVADRTGEDPEHLATIQAGILVDVITI